MLKLITDCMQNKSYYIVKGLLEPIHLKTDERELLVEGMQTSVGKIVEEVYKSAKICEDTFGSISKEMQITIEETKEFYNKFSTLLHEKPYTL